MAWRRSGTTHTSPKRCWAEVGELFLDFYDIQEGDDPLRREAEPPRAGWGLFQLEGNEAGPARTLRFQIFNRLQALLMILDDEVLEPLAQHGFDDGFVLGVGLDDVFDQSVNPVLGGSLGLALQQDRPDPGLIPFEIPLQLQKRFQAGALLIQLFPAAGELFPQIGKGRLQFLDKGRLSAPALPRSDRGRCAGRSAGAPADQERANLLHFVLRLFLFPATFSMRWISSSVRRFEPGAGSSGRPIG